MVRDGGPAAVLPSPRRAALVAVAVALPVAVACGGLIALVPVLIGLVFLHAGPAEGWLARMVPAAAVATAVLLALIYWSSYRQAQSIRALMTAADDASGEALETLPPSGRFSRVLRFEQGTRAAALMIRAMRQRVTNAEELAEMRRSRAESAGRGVLEVAAAMVNAEERVRTLIVSDLHDTVAQTLHVTRYQAEELGEKVADMLAMLPSSILGSEMEAAKLVGEVMDNVAAAERQLRAIMASVRSPALSEADLGRAVESYVSDLATRYGVEVTVHWPAAAMVMPAEWALTCYRFIQESLANVVKHARTDHAEVTFLGDDHTVVVTVVDYGEGFAEPEPDARAGYHIGTELMATRVDALGGTLTVQSEPGEGTVVMLTLPLPVDCPRVRADAPAREDVGASAPEQTLGARHRRS